jgi:hypothetical protein
MRVAESNIFGNSMLQIEVHHLILFIYLYTSFSFFDIHATSLSLFDTAYEEYSSYLL